MDIIKYFTAHNVKDLSEAVYSAVFCIWIIDNTSSCLLPPSLFNELKKSENLEILVAICSV